MGLDSIFTWIFAQKSIGWTLWIATIVSVPVMMVFGKLYTSGQVDRERERDKETIARQEATIIRQASTITLSNEAFEKLAEPIHKVLEQGELTVYAIKELKTAADRRSG